MRGTCSLPWHTRTPAHGHALTHVRAYAQHVLPAMGGASGIGQSLVEACARLDANLLALGTRGMGAFKSSLMAFIGLGSVSDYCLHNVTVINGQGSLLGPLWGHFKVGLRLLPAQHEGDKT